MQTYMVTADWLRLRAGPGIDHKTLGYLARNSLVNGGERAGDWLLVTNSNGQAGWSSLKHLRQVEAQAPQPESGIGRFTVIGGALNVRKGPGRNYGIAGTLTRGDIVEGVSQSLDGHWTQVRANGLEGWCSTKYLTRAVAATPPAGSEAEMIVTADALNIRSSPGAVHSIVGTLRRGEIVKVVNVSPDWTWMQVGGEAGGWCASKFLIERDMLTVTADDLNATGMQRVATYLLAIREKPSADAPVVGNLNFNQVVVVDQISDDGLWKRCTTALGISGWCSYQYLASLEAVIGSPEHEEFPWVSVAFNELGTAEVPGLESNPKILDYLASTNLFKFPYLPDETNWCAAFVNWCVEKAGAASMNSALVFPWTRWGDALDKPRRGCLVVFQWDEGGQHISIYLGELGNYVVALGGNQGDAVWINVYHKRHVIAYRAPAVDMQLA